MKYTLGQYAREAAHRCARIGRTMRILCPLLHTKEERRVGAYRDKYRGKRAFILGMGPSLCVADLELIRNEISFACNKIYLIFPQTSWRPDFYFVIDLLVARQNVEQIKSINLASFFPCALRTEIGSATDALFYPYMAGLSSSDGRPLPRFSTNLYKGLGSNGFTVIYDQLQWAFWMGFSEVVLLGVDFNFTIGAATGEVCAHGAVLQSAGEVNHFHPDYRKPGEKWTYPQLEYQRTAFALAAETYARNGRKLWNASRRTALDCIPLITLEEVLQRPPHRR